MIGLGCTVWLQSHRHQASQTDRQTDRHVAIARPFINGRLKRLYFAAPGEINCQVRFDETGMISALRILYRNFTDRRAVLGYRETSQILCMNYRNKSLRGISATAELLVILSK